MFITKSQSFAAQNNMMTIWKRMIQHFRRYILGEINSVVFTERAKKERIVYEVGKQKEQLPMKPTWKETKRLEEKHKKV